MYKCGFGQAYDIDLLNRILTKFNLYFFELYCIFYEFWNLERISRISKWKMKLEKKKWCFPSWWGGWRQPAGGREAVRSPGGASVVRGGGTRQG
jgi:hypothetical protein